MDLKHNNIFVFKGVLALHADSAPPLGPQDGPQEALGSHVLLKKHHHGSRDGHHSSSDDSEEDDGVQSCSQIRPMRRLMPNKVLK